MFISFKGIMAEDYENHIAKNIGRYVMQFGKLPDSIKVSIEDFYDIKYDMIDPRAHAGEGNKVQYYLKFYSTALPIEIL